jgi:hypothetical protein
VGFGVAKARGDAQALADALRDHDDIEAALGHYDAVRQSNSEHIALFDHLVGAGEERWRDLGSISECAAR